MSGLAVFSILVVILMLLACGAAFPELRRWPIPRWRLAVPSLLIAAATLVLLYLPPSNDLREPQVWMMALVAAVLGLARVAAGAGPRPGRPAGRSGRRARARARPPPGPTSRPAARAGRWRAAGRAARASPRRSARTAQRGASAGSATGAARERPQRRPTASGRRPEWKRQPDRSSTSREGPARGTHEAHDGAPAVPCSMRSPTATHRARRTVFVTDCAILHRAAPALTLSTTSP